MSGALEVLKNEFQKKNLWLSFHNDEVFHRSQWRWPSVIYVIYRVFIALYIWFWLFYSIYIVPVWATQTGDCKGTPHYWPAFLTNWSYTVLALHLTVSAIVTVYRSWPFGKDLISRPDPLAACKPEEADSPEQKLPIGIRIQWCLFAIIANFAWVVTLIYFVVLYPAKNAKQREENPGAPLKPPHPVDLHLHAVNSLVVLIDLAIGAFPVRLMHCIYPIIYGLCYVLFSLFYWIPKNDEGKHCNVIYTNVLDWNQPGTTIAVVLGLGFVLTPLLQLAVFGLYRLRLWAFTKCQS